MTLKADGARVNGFVDLLTPYGGMLAAAPTPVLSGVLDLDRTLFGDPAAD
ncbi:hypothetical protein [Streptomyces hirsutus]